MRAVRIGSLRLTWKGILLWFAILLPIVLLELFLIGWSGVRLRDKEIPEKFERIQIGMTAKDLSEAAPNCAMHIVSGFSPANDLQAACSNMKDMFGAMWIGELSSIPKSRIYLSEKDGKVVQKGLYEPTPWDVLERWYILAKWRLKL